jgi:magnesium-transporting ATPase (P-type)
MFVWWCLTPLPTIFQLYRGGQFYWWRKLEYPEKTIEATRLCSYSLMLRAWLKRSEYQFHSFTFDPSNDQTDDIPNSNRTLESLLDQSRQKIWTWKSLFLVGSCCSIFSFMCIFCRSLFVPLSFYLLAIVLFALLLLRLLITHWHLQTFSYFRKTRLTSQQTVLIIFMFIFFVWPPRYNWNIVGSGVKHHQPTNHQLNMSFYADIYIILTPRQPDFAPTL